MGFHSALRPILFDCDLSLCQSRRNKLHRMESALMRKMLNIFMLGVFTVASVALAKQNDCENFHIQISNLTGAPCILTCLKRIHGSLITPPPMTILPNDSKRFDVSQTLFGPAI